LLKNVDEKTYREFTVNVFKGLFSSLKSRFDNLDAAKNIAPQGKGGAQKNVGAKQKVRRQPNEQEKAFLVISSSALNPQVQPFIDNSEKALVYPFMDLEVCGYFYEYIQLVIKELNLSDNPIDDAYFTLTEHCLRDIVGDSAGGLSYGIVLACHNGRGSIDFDNGATLAASDHEEIKKSGKSPTQLANLINRSIFVYTFLDATKLFGESESIQTRTRIAKLQFGQTDSPFIAAMDYAADWISRLSEYTPLEELCSSGGPLFRVVGGICELVIDKKADYADGLRYFEQVISHMKTQPPEGMGELEKVLNFDEMLKRNYKALKITWMIGTKSIISTES
jgi:hypothetical protein